MLRKVVGNLECLRVKILARGTNHYLKFRHLNDQKAKENLLRRSSYYVIIYANHRYRGRFQRLLSIKRFLKWFWNGSSQTFFPEKRLMSFFEIFESRSTFQNFCLYERINSDILRETSKTSEFSVIWRCQKTTRVQKCQINDLSTKMTDMGSKLSKIPYTKMPEKKTQSKKITFWHFLFTFWIFIKFSDIFGCNLYLSPTKISMRFLFGSYCMIHTSRQGSTHQSRLVLGPGGTFW